MPLLVFGLAQPAISATPQTPQAVTDAIRAALNMPDDSSVTLGSVAGAQFMQACRGKMNVTITGLPPYQQAAVQCPAPLWTLYVAVTIINRTNIAVAARQIAAGQVLAPDDIRLQLEPSTLYAGRQVFYQRAAVAGSTALMSMPAGSILTTGNVAPPLIVSAGQTVNVTIRSGAVQVSISAIATQAGRVGDMILLTNPSTGKHFPALVTSEGPVVNLAF
ncbi:MAG TPA: flagellar basal body P-ring formation chaperone FlgA [Acidocella sp.]|nr:flagellar basal body P-ring formation chaperone FlgA [Acidocella sp.]